MIKLIEKPAYVCVLDKIKKNQFFKYNFLTDATIFFKK